MPRLTPTCTQWPTTQFSWPFGDCNEICYHCKSKDYDKSKLNNDESGIGLDFDFQVLRKMELQSDFKSIFHVGFEG